MNGNIQTHIKIIYAQYRVWQTNPTKRLEHSSSATSRIPSSINCEDSGSHDNLLHQVSLNDP